VRNSRCGVSIKDARKEWHPPKEVLNSANIEGRDRRGLVQLPNSFGLHGARGLKVQILKGTKEHQVQSSFAGITVVAPLDSVQGTHSTVEEELRTYNPHAVWVGNGRCNVEISTTFANVVWIGGDSCNTFLVDIQVVRLVYTRYILIIYIVCYMHKINIYLVYIYKKYGI
jgi:hypothetical protein